MQLWVSYTASFEYVLAAWETGDFSLVRPAAGQPLGGLYTCIEWSRQRGEVGRFVPLHRHTDHSTTLRYFVGEAIRAHRDDRSGGNGR